MLDLNDAIILACAAQGGAMASVATGQTGLTRVAVSRRIKKLADSGYLQRHGTGTRQTYSLGDKRFWLGLQQRESILQRGGEMAVWEQRLAPLLTDLKPNVKSLVNTAFTEMLNNALDHSNGLQVLMGMHLEGGQLQMVVADDSRASFTKLPNRHTCLMNAWPFWSWPKASSPRPPKAIRAWAFLCRPA